VHLAWDPRKDRVNRKKHGLSFDQAAALFRRDDLCLEFFDEEHSEQEERFIAIGPIADGIVVVVFTESDDNVLRILSARWATSRERRRYEEFKAKHGRRRS